jgi:hypothetical protein
LRDLRKSRWDNLRPSQPIAQTPIWTHKRDDDFQGPSRDGDISEETANLIGRQPVAHLYDLLTGDPLGQAPASEPMLVHVNHKYESEQPGEQSTLTQVRISRQQERNTKHHQSQETGQKTQHDMIQ